MSFGYSVGDFIAVGTIIHRVTEKIRNAPDEYRGLAKEVQSLGIAIREASTAAAPAASPTATATATAGSSSNGPAAPPGTTRLQELERSCLDVLVELERELNKYNDLGSPAGGSTPGSASSSGSNMFRRIVGRRAKRGWQRFWFDPEKIRKVRVQLTTHLESYNTLQLNSARSTINSISQGVDQLQVEQTQVGQNVNSVHHSLGQMTLLQQSDSQNITSIGHGVQQLHAGQAQMGRNLDQMQLRQQEDSQHITNIDQGVQQLGGGQVQMSQSLSLISVRQQSDSQSITSIGQSVDKLNVVQDKMSLQQQTDSQNIVSISEGVDQLNLTQKALTDSQERIKILDWISPVDFASTQQDIINRRQKGTGEWFLSSSEYQTWLRSPGQTLFCPGIPGAGKTMLTAIAIDHLDSEIIQTTENVGIAYIYFNYQKEGSQGVMGVLASLLRQLCAYRNPLPTEIQAAYEKCTKVSHRSFTQDELVESLDVVVGMFSRVFVLLDALDECRQGLTLLSILSEMFEIQKKRANVNLLATSRYIPEIMSEFNDSEQGRKTPVIEVRANEADVRRYLEGQSRDLRPFARRDKELQEQIVAKIVDSVQGMFLLAQLHFRSISEYTDKKSVRQALSRLQSGSDAYEIAYEEAMGRIKRQRARQAELAIRVLAWITCAARPLYTVELQHALAVEEDEDSVDMDKITDVDDLVSYCAGLVIVDKKSGIIRLVHYTTREYFDREKNKWFPSADDDMASVCLRYISMPAFERGSCSSWDEFRSRRMRNPLYSYAAGYWGYHARANWRACKELLIRFQMSNPIAIAAAQVVFELDGKPGGVEEGVGRKVPVGKYQAPSRLPGILTGLHLMTYFGLCEAVESLVDCCWKGRTDAKTTSHGQTLLTWAAMFGREDIARMLISKGADIDYKDRLGRSPIWWASFCGYDEVVKLLIQKGACCHLKDSQGIDPLSIAAMHGHEGVICALFTAMPPVPLLFRSVNPNTLDTALMYPCGYLHEGAVQQILRANPLQSWRLYYVNRISREGRTALSLAMGKWESSDRRKRLPVVKMLLDAGANPNTGVVDNRIFGTPPILRAVESIDLLELFLSRGAAWDRSDKQGRTALHRAVEDLPSPERLKLLLDAGANINTPDICGWRPLNYALYNYPLLLARGCQKHFSEVREWVDLLLAHGADVNVTDIAGRTPLIHLVTMGLKEEIRLLISVGVDLDVEDKFGKRALWYAAQRADEEMVKILLAGGAKVFEGEEDPLELARTCKKTKPTEFCDPVAAIGRFYRPAGFIIRLRGG